MGNKTAGVRIASGSTIEIDFYFKNRRCRERIKLKPTPNNIAYCTKLKAHIELLIGKGEFDYQKQFPDSPRAKQFSEMPGDVVLIKNHLESWLTAERDNVKHSTWLGYKKIIDYHLAPTFGELALGELRRKHVWNWVAGQKQMSAKRIRNVLSVLRVAFNAAVEQELIEANPLSSFKVRKRVVAKPNEIDPFSYQERVAILSVLKNQDRNVIEFAFLTGLRTSELVALNWTDVDWVQGVIRISRVMTLGMDEPEDGAKTAAGVRDVKLLGPALQVLQAQKAHTLLKGAEIFQNPRTGERWTGDKCIRQGMWAPALRKAGVRYRKPYQTRHTFASMALMAGESPMWVAKMMGHTDWSFTAKRYARWIPSDMPDAGSKMAAAWSAFGQRAVASN